MDEGVELGRRKLEGLANKDYAAALKDFADSEEKKIKAEFERRSLESKVSKEESEARLAALKVIDAEIDLYTKLSNAGLTLFKDQSGNLTVLPKFPRADELIKGEIADEAEARDPQ